MATKLPVFDTAYPRTSVNVVMTPEGASNWPRKDYPWDEHARCLVLVPNRFYVLESTKDPSIIGLPIVISSSLTKAWRKGQDFNEKGEPLPGKTAGHRVNLFRDGLASIAHGAEDPKYREHNFTSDCYTASVELAENMLTGSQAAEDLISGTGPPDLPVWDDLNWYLSGTVTYPFGPCLNFAGERLGLSASTYRAGGRLNRILAERYRLHAQLALRLPSQLMTLARLTAEATTELKKGPEISSHVLLQLQELESQLSQVLESYQQPLMDRLNGRLNTGPGEQTRNGVMRLRAGIQALTRDRPNWEPEDAEGGIMRLKLAARELIPRAPITKEAK